MYGFVPLTAVKEISDLLNTGLDDETLRICVQLLEAGINPEALADVVKELRREVAAIRVSYPPPLSSLFAFNSLFDRRESHCLG